MKLRTVRTKNDFDSYCYMVADGCLNLVVSFEVLLMQSARLQSCILVENLYRLTITTYISHDCSFVPR